MSGFCIAKARTHLRNSSNNKNNSNDYGSGTKCGRWNPTAEQVKVLTELFRSGLRTPSTDQIQKISSQLSFYGKIESKNVFYWFQNHKARERQKRRRVNLDDNDVVLSSSSIISPPSNLIRRDDPFSSSARYFSEMSHNRQLQYYNEEPPAAKAERVIETLQLFPLNSFNDAADHHQYYYGRKEAAAAARGFSCGFSSEMDHPPLDLRLSFL
ncbi:unnamed protein product [Linum tenue]|uniref:Homeobox domain-containing protein n=1 Tax=Linum tenue TaxID=586396 RepID=A0AAV0JM83_9ROSI|nr:unnamed protein product [Linum tenue]